VIQQQAGAFSSDTNSRPKRIVSQTMLDDAVAQTRDALNEEKAKAKTYRVALLALVVLVGMIGAFAIFKNMSLQQQVDKTTQSVETVSKKLETADQLRDQLTAQIEKRSRNFTRTCRKSRVILAPLTKGAN
jgi:cell division protein FtsB